MARSPTEAEKSTGKTVAKSATYPHKNTPYENTPQPRQTTRTEPNTTAALPTRHTANKRAKTLRVHGGVQATVHVVYKGLYNKHMLVKRGRG